MEEREQNMEKTYALILGQCSKTIRDRIEAHEQWEVVNTSSNALGLLRLIRQSLYQRATRRQETHALIEAETALMRFRQSERMSNSDYLEKLRDLVEVYEHLGGEPGTSKARVDTLLMDPELADDDERMEAKTKAREEYLAVLLLTKSDPKRYGTLVTDVENAYTRGQNGYPTTVSGAYDMLVNYKNPNHALRMQNQDTGIAFVQDSQDIADNNEASQEHGRQQCDYGRGGRGRHGGREGGRGRGCGGRGGRTGMSYTVEQQEDNEEVSLDKNNLGQAVGPYSLEHRCVDDRIPSTTPGAEPPRDARILVQLGHTQRTQKLAPQTDPKRSPTRSVTRYQDQISVKCTRWKLRMPSFTRAPHAQPCLSNFTRRDSDFGEPTCSRGTTRLERNFPTSPQNKKTKLTHRSLYMSLRTILTPHVN